MVDSKGKLLDNIIKFPSSASKTLPRAATLSDVEISLDASTEISQPNKFPTVDFGLPSFTGEDRTVALIIGISFVMAIFIVAIAFGTASLALKLLSWLS
jgi:hypothetical protein